MAAINTSSDNYTGPRLFGAPVGDFSLLQTLLFIFAATIGALMFGTFVGIVTLGFVSAIQHHAANFAGSYLWFGLPLGAVMFLFSTIYLGGILIRRWVKG